MTGIMSGDAEVKIAVIEESVKSLNATCERMESQQSETNKALNTLILINHRVDNVEAEMGKIKGKQQDHGDKINKWIGGLAVMVFAIPIAAKYLL